MGTVLMLTAVEVRDSW